MFDNKFELQIKSVIEGPSGEAQLHMAAYSNNELAFSLSGAGDAVIAGSLQACNRSLVVDPRLISGQNLRLSNDLHVMGSANVEDSLTIGTGFALNPAGMTVDVASHSGTLFELRSRQVGFNGTLMELNSVGEDSTLIRAISNGLTAFELHTSGDVKMNGLRLASGGIQVQSGGIDVSYHVLYSNLAAIWVHCSQHMQHLLIKTLFSCLIFMLCILHYIS